MKKANKRFRREMMAAERQEKAGKRNYSLGNARIDDEDDEGVMLYAGNGIMVSCSAMRIVEACERQNQQANLQVQKNYVQCKYLLSCLYRRRMKNG